MQKGCLELIILPGALLRISVLTTGSKPVFKESENVVKSTSSPNIAIKYINLKVDISFYSSGIDPHIKA